jgi:hypothetical protein
LIVLPSYPFPSLAWCQIAYNSDTLSEEIVVDIHENFVKQTMRNRILLSNAQGEMILSLPVHRRNAISRSLSDILFTDAMSPTVLMRHLKTGYGSAPYFEHYEDSLIEFLETYGKPGMSLIDFNMGSLRWIEDELELSSVNQSSHFIRHTEIENPSHDLRVRGSFSSKSWSYKRYPQVFEDRNSFVSGCSVLDGIFHGGQDVKNWWKKKVTRLSSRHE